MPPTSRARAAKRAQPRPAQAGIILLDVIIALALFALLALLVLPTLPRGTTAARQGAYVAQIAAVMKTDRTSAARQGHEVATRIDVANRRILSGASNAVVTLPSDLTLDVVASDLCTSGTGGFAIVFAPDGRSCGAVIRVSKAGLDWRIRVHWLTGHIDVVAPDRG